MTHRLMVLLLLVALVVAACGDGDDSPDSTRTADPSATSTSAEPADPVTAEPVLLSASPGVNRSDPVADAPVAGLVAGLNDAGFELWRSQATEGNLVLSPASIGHALLMARAAADDVTGDAIEQAFGLPPGLGAHQAWNAADQLIAAAGDAEDEIVVAIADRIWPRVDITPDQAWVDLLAAEHGATTETLDYLGDPTGSRETINQWVSDQTEALIPELIPEGLINAQTVLILTDAIYFKAAWQRPFGKYQPVRDDFTLLDGSTVSIEFMRELELGDRRGAGDGFVGVEIPYKGGDFSMLVIVPDEGRFTEVHDRLDQGLLDEIDTRFTTGPFELLIPKWSTTTQIDLMPWLAAIGAAPGAYPSISPGAFLGAAVHGADIAVDELGTVAAAATAPFFNVSGPLEPDLIIKADTPFLYLIRHRPTGLVLFAGQVTNPTS